MTRLKSRSRQWLNVFVLMLIVATVFAGCAPAKNEEAEPVSESGSETIDGIKEYGALRIGVAVALPWMGINPADGKYFGPAMDISNWLGEELGVPVEIMVADWGVIVAGLQANKYDLIATGLFETPERKEVIDFATWHRAGGCYIAMKDNDKVNTLEDLRNPDVKLAVILGAGLTAAVQEKYPEPQYIEEQVSGGASTNLMAILAGRADASAIDSAVGPAHLEVYPELKLIPEDCLENPDVAMDIGVAFRKNDPVFAAMVEGVIAKHKAEIEEGLETYSSSEYLNIARQ